jgi:hypothetical protein
MSEIILKNFKKREPILIEEIKELFKKEKENTINQYISALNKFNIIKKFCDGIYYIPEDNKRFKDLEPSILEAMEKKYLRNYSGFRTGAGLMNKYGFTTQVSEYYEIISSNVSENTRNRKVLKGKVIVSAAKINLNKENYYYLIYAEILRNIKYSDLKKEENLYKLKELINEFNLKQNKIKKMLSYYKGNRLKYIHDLYGEVENYEIT